MKDGFGKFKWSNYSHYEGEYKEDKRHGFGKMSYSKGNVYEGHWLND